MSINNKTGQERSRRLSPEDSLTEGNRALQLFTDRYEFIRLFADYFKVDLPREKSCTFMGMAVALCCCHPHNSDADQF